MFLVRLPIIELLSLSLDSSLLLFELHLELVDVLFLILVRNKVVRLTIFHTDKTLMFVIWFQSVMDWLNKIIGRFHGWSL